MKPAVLLVLFAPLIMIPANADEFTYCLENTTQSQSWQKPLCFESVKCEIPNPRIYFDNDSLDLNYRITLDQFKTFCKDHYGFTKIVVSPQSFNLKIYDDDFDYMIYNSTTTELKDNTIELQKDIPYRIILTTSWQTSEVSSYMFIEDDYGNLVEQKPKVHTQTTDQIILVPFEHSFD